MLIDISTRLDYNFAQPTDCLFQFEAAHQPDQVVKRARLDTGPTELFARAPAEDGVGERVWARIDGRMTWRYSARVEVRRPVPDIAAMGLTPLRELPPDVVKYLFTSRYCPSDKFQSFVAAEFGNLSGGAQVMAMRDWIESGFAYVPGVSTVDTSALETFVMRKGICRDFAHVLITLCRAAAIPARIASVYGMGVEPPDFHAVAEVWLEGAWHLVDPTGMSQADRMVRICVGRDAADVAFLTSFGVAELIEQEVSVTEAAKETAPQG